MDINNEVSKIMADFGWDSTPKRMQLTQHIKRIVSATQDECVVEISKQKAIEASAKIPPSPITID